MMLGAITAAWSGKKLPFLRRVAYLESHGTEWIDTGVNAKQTLKIRAVFEINLPEESYFVYGVRFGNSTITCASGSTINYGYARWGMSAYTQNVPYGLVDITQDSSGVIIKGILYSYNAKETVIEQSGYTMVIFAGRNSLTTVTANMVGKIYSYVIWDNGVLVRDFIPVLDLSGRPAMYDEVSGQLFYNQGTGEFTWGELNAA